MLTKEKVDGVVYCSKIPNIRNCKDILSRKLTYLLKNQWLQHWIKPKHLVNIAKRNKLIYIVGNKRKHDSGIKKGLELFQTKLKNGSLGNFIHYKHYVLAGDYCNIDGYIPSKEKFQKEKLSRFSKMVT